MEANFLRFLIEELQGQIQGKRLEKVYQPARGLWSIKLGSAAFLLLLIGKKENCLFFSSSRPENPLYPDSQVLWWRKRLAGRRILGCVSDWPRRRVAWQLSPGQSKWLIMDLVQGLSLQEELFPEMEQAVIWPTLEDVIGNKYIYRLYPHLTPPLRNSLQSMESIQARELLTRLSQGQPQGFYGYWRQGRAYAVLPWKLPAELAQDLEYKEYSRAMDAAWDYGWSVFQEIIGLASEQLSLKQSRGKRLRKAWKRLEKEEARLQQLAPLQEWAYLLQNNLGRLDRRQKHKQVEAVDAQGRKQIVELDPSLSVLENMQLWFRQSAKVQRGLLDIARRKQELQQELRNLAQGKQVWPNGQLDSRASQGYAARQGQDLERLLPARARGLQVKVYKTSHGFLLLRGKNQKANHKLLSQAARPFDFWFHIQEGQGAHVILLRDSPQQEVPWDDMQEAAVLAGLASVQKTSSKAEVCCALVKSVRKVKGAPLGQVQVQCIEHTFLVELDAGLEQRLCIK
ncbi:MAG: NFACT RNA binding domain-containing protein [Desulfohalobiaceae bacterium]